LIAKSTVAETARYAAGFAPRPDPDRATPAAVAGPNGKGARKRYNVYRNNVTVSLINALAAVFPATMRITGVDFFRAMARLSRATPPTSPLLFEYVATFRSSRLRIRASMPWLGCARIAGVARRLSCARDAEPLASLACFGPRGTAGGDRPDAASATDRASRFPAVSIFTAKRRPVGRIETADRSDALVTKPPRGRPQPAAARHLPARLIEGNASAPALPLRRSP
jgi:hypothetical protein